MKIEVKDDDKVVIDGFEFYGHIEQEQFCSKCEFNLVYNEDFDAYFCPKCNYWNEAQCSDPDCEYCPNRPEKPLPHK
ncbi:hypothetical protein [Rummeliibacillus pycnus]|uniref:hypothetical protein n=1 Tax=Rummeliibacillus pycnus TaxID=101070 RepID=UPI0037C72E8C